MATVSVSITIDTPGLARLRGRFWRWVARQCAPHIAGDLYDALRKVR